MPSGRQHAAIVQPECSLPCAQKPATGHCPEPVESTPYCVHKPPAPCRGQKGRAHLTWVSYIDREDTQCALSDLDLLYTHCFINCCVLFSNAFSLTAEVFVCTYIFMTMHSFYPLFMRRTFAVCRHVFLTN